jgi:hypothetical protein
MHEQHVFVNVAQQVVSVAQHVVRAPYSGADEIRHKVVFRVQQNPHTLHVPGWHGIYACEANV